MSQLKRLQSLQDAAARLIYGGSKCCHMTPLLESLHWLRMPERVDYKLCLMVFKALHGLAPDYLAELMRKTHINERGITLRSARSCASQLEMPKRQSCTVFGDRSFRTAGPAAWNALPEKLRVQDSETTFRRLLKTHLFSR